MTEKPRRRRAAPPIAPRAGAIGGLIAVVALATGFVAGLAGFAGLAAERAASGWSAALADAATVRTPDAASAEAAAAILATAPGIGAIHLLSEAETAALLAPWLGAKADLSALPVPRLIDVRLVGDGPDREELARRLEAAAPGAVWDEHRAWRAPLLEAARGVRGAAAAAIGFAALALAAMVGVAAAATLWSGAGIVRTLRLIGAEDRFITRAFERPFALRAGAGALIGAGAATALAFAAPRIEGLGALGGAPDAAAPLWLAAAAPLFAGLLAALVALCATRIAAWLVLRRE